MVEGTIVKLPLFPRVVLLLRRHVDVARGLLNALIQLESSSTFERMQLATGATCAHASDDAIAVEVDAAAVLTVDRVALLEGPDVTSTQTLEELLPSYRADNDQGLRV